MPTEKQLLEDYIEWFLKHTGKSEAEQAVLKEQFRQMFGEKIDEANSPLLSELQYRETFAAMQKEAPAFLYHLQNNPFPDLPTDN